MQLLWPSRADSCWNRRSHRRTSYFLVKARSQLGPHPVSLQTAANELHAVVQVSAQGIEQFSAFKLQQPLASPSCQTHNPWERIESPNLSLRWD